MSQLTFPESSNNNYIAFTSLVQHKKTSGE